MSSISVLMSVYKEPTEWLRESIDSILNQTFKDFEFIIICDNPSYEAGIELLHNYSKEDSRIVFIMNEQNMGLTRSLNKGLTFAKGDYIARMDADDISLPDRLKKQYYYLEKHPEVVVCGSDIVLFGDQKRRVSYPETMDEMFLFLESPFAHPSIMARSTWMKQVKYDESFVVSQDYKLWIDLYEQGAVFYNIQEPLLMYRMSNTQISSNPKKHKAQLEASITIRRKALSLYCKDHRINNPLEKVSSIDYSSLCEALETIELPNEQKKQFLFYLYCSLNCSVVKKVWYMLKNGHFILLNSKDFLRVILYSIKRIDNRKY